MKNPRNRIEPDGTVPLHLSDRERLLILDETTVVAGCSSEIEDKLRDATPARRKLVVHLTVEELDELADCVAAAANHAEDGAVEKVLDRLCDRIENLLDTYH